MADILKRIVDELYRDSYRWCYGDSKPPLSPSRFQYATRLGIIVPLQTIATFGILIIMLGMTVIGNCVTIPLGFGFFYVEGFISFRFKMRGYEIYPPAFLIPLYVFVCVWFIAGKWWAIPILLVLGGIPAAIVVYDRLQTRLVF